jgi:hypothetical protein
MTIRRHTGRRELERGDGLSKVVRRLLPQVVESTKQQLRGALGMLGFLYWWGDTEERLEPACELGRGVAHILEGKLQRLRPDLVPSAAIDQ